MTANLGLQFSDEDQASAREILSHLKKNHLFQTIHSELLVLQKEKEVCSKKEIVLWRDIDGEREREEREERHGREGQKEERMTEKKVSRVDRKKKERHTDRNREIERNNQHEKESAVVF